MGLLQEAVKTYDSHKEYVGKAIEGHKMLAPISHIMTKADIEITIDAEGNYVDAALIDKENQATVIPVTENSAGRTSAPCAHPLCDQLCYLGNFNEKRHSLYIQQLHLWVESKYVHPKVRAVLLYIEKESIIDDLASREIIKIDKKGIPEKEKMLVRWRILGTGEEDCCWKDKTLFESYIQFYEALSTEREKQLCIVSGKDEVIATQHPKGIIPINGNAKLISANDNENFTYRGRFTEEWQSATVGYEISQKAHNAIRWIAAEQGAQVQFGGRTFLCWNPNGVELPKATGPFKLKSKDTINIKPSDYRGELKKTLAGYQTSLPVNGNAVIACFDAATTGRLALTYYNELQASDFLNRLYQWDESCCWYNGKFGIQSPSLFNIVSNAFGTERVEKGISKMAVDDRILRQQMQNIMACRLEGGRIPADIEKALVNRASSPQAYDRNVWLNILFTACAVINKEYKDRKGADAMSWELIRKDRSFQYGRLLAVMERLEEDYYNKTDSGRMTNAIKSMDAFKQRPFSTFERVNALLCRAYLNRVSDFSKNRYKRLVGEITSIISEFPEGELNNPLDDVYLMGYCMQRNAFFEKKENSESEINENAGGEDNE